MTKIDLHTHSSVSDGEETPEQLVDMAKSLGLLAIAVSDHDSLEGSKRAVVRGQAIDIKVIPAVELSTILAGQPIHVLGYGIDLENSPLAQSIQAICEYREKRAKYIVEQVNAELEQESKTPLDLNKVLELGKAKPITRGDLALMLLDLGHVESRQGAFDKYLEKYNYPNKDLRVQEVIDKIHGAHGLAVLAHPNSEFISLKSLSSEFQEHTRIITELKEQGLDGLEVYRSEHSKEDTQRYLELAESLKLLALGGSDYHGANVESGAPLASVDVPENVLKEMEAARGSLYATHY